MEIPEHLHKLVDDLGQALVQALAKDPHCRELARQIQAEGFDIGLMIEATIALHRREEGEPEGEGEEAPESYTWLNPSDFLPSEAHSQERAQWSEEDRAFLRKFKISLD